MLRCYGIIWEASARLNAPPEVVQPEFMNVRAHDNGWRGDTSKPELAFLTAFPGDPLSRSDAHG